MYDCTSELLSHQENLNQMLDITKTKQKSLPAFRDREVTYLKEFIELMEPLAIALDTLQADKEMYFGQLIPTLFSLKARLSAMQISGFTVITPMTLEKIVFALHKRFVNEFELNEPARIAVVATVSNPYYKLRWAFDEEVESKARRMFKEEVKKVVQQQKRQPTTTSAPSSPSSSNAVASGSSQVAKSSGFIILRPTTTIKDEADVYLEDIRDDLKHLEGYPIVSKVFKRFNTPLCSSAPLERIFNYAGMINNPKRGAIVPSNFEKSVILKGNQVFKSREQKKDK